MYLLLRVLVLCLVMSTGGLLNALELVVDAHADCADEEDEGGCDCSTCVTNCACCPARLAVATMTRSMATSGRPSRFVLAAPDAQVTGGRSLDIFHPPRA